MTRTIYQRCPDSSQSSEGGTRTRDTTIMSRVLDPEANDDEEKPEIIDDYVDEVTSD